MKLNLGCWDYKLPGFINIDIDPGVSPDLVADCLALPYPDASVDEIYAGHLLEHFTLTEGQRALDEWHRVLVPGGKITLTVPDTEKAIREYRLGRMDRDWLEQVVYGAQDRQEQNHHQVFTTALLRLDMERRFERVTELPTSPLAVANVDWQTIMEGYKRG